MVSFDPLKAAALWRQPRAWIPPLVLAAGIALAFVTSSEMRRSEREHRNMQLSNLVDSFGALLQMHLNGCEEALHAAAMEAGAASRVDERMWQLIGRQVRAGEYNVCAESIVYLDASTER